MVVFPRIYAIFLWWDNRFVSERLAEFSCFITLISSIH